MQVSQPASFDAVAAVVGRGVAFFEVGRRVGAYQLGGYTNRTCPHKSSTSCQSLFSELLTNSKSEAESTVTPASLMESSGGAFDYSAAGSVARSWDPREAARVIWLTGEAF